MSAHPSIDDLNNESRFEKVMTLRYGEIAHFVVSMFRSVSFPMLLLWLTIAVCVIICIWFWPGIRYSPEKPMILRGLATGFILIPLLLAPVHEGLHLIPFRLAGARDIRIGADLRQGIIYITAHRFVAGRRLFSYVALTPFIGITVILAFIIIFANPWWQWVMSMALLTHSTMCAGDTALLGYMYGFGKREVYTWDDADTREAYFFASIHNVSLQ